jgi:hypothetical protein
MGIFMRPAMEEVEIMSRPVIFTHIILRMLFETREMKDMQRVSIITILWLGD